jgi:DNA-binding transcriptional MerR regulator
MIASVFIFGVFHILMGNEGIITRKEIMVLTGVTSNQLQYFERANLIQPTRVLKDGRKRPDVYYSWAQLLEVKAICELRQETSLQTIRKILDYLDQYQTDRTLRNKQIVVINGEAFWVKLDWEDFGKQISALKVADKRNKGVGQYTLIVIPALKDLEEEIWKTASESTVIDLEDFRERVRKQKNKAA